jgi:predicted AAA+ superfamily ATPase
MKDLIRQLIDDFHERDLPDLQVRDFVFSELPDKADVAIGMRRTGKTYFCYQQIKKLLSSEIPTDRLLYLNFEDDRLLDFSAGDFQTILDIYFEKFPENKNMRCFFFFDEIQRIDNWEIFIRRLLDTENIQLYLTGSSSKLLSKEIASSLRGRSLSTEIFPFSFNEYLKYHDVFKKTPAKFSSRTISFLRKNASDYLEKGGFPEVQKVDKNLRLEILQSYIDSVLLRDVIERHGISNVVALKHLVNSIMNSPYTQFSVNKFYNTLKSMSIKCTKNNLYEYLDHLTDAYLFYRVPLHTRSEKARLVNPAKIYVIDTGLINAMTFRNSIDKGRLLENIVYMQFRRKGYKIEYFHSEKGYETDFYVQHPINNDTQLIQVCWDMSKEKTFARELRGLEAAVSETGITDASIITWDEESELENGIKIIPVWKWLLK